MSRKTNGYWIILRPTIILVPPKIALYVLVFSLQAHGGDPAVTVGSLRLNYEWMTG
jgi:hypothetical protein